jgi:RNA polymerase sigma-70 factor (sigma-E family)
MVTPMTADDVPTPAVPVECFDDFYRREYSTILALAYGLTGNRTLAEDVTQDAFLAAHRGWDRIAQYDAPGAWVRQVVINRSRSAWRRARAEAQALRRLGGRRPNVFEAMADDSDRFWGAVRHLPRRQAQCIALRYLDDLDHAEIAEILGLAAATVRVHLHRARRALARQLQLEDQEEP